MVETSWVDINKEKENKSININLDYCEDILSNKSLEESKIGYVLPINSKMNISPLKQYRSEGIFIFIFKFKLSLNAKFLL